MLCSFVHLIMLIITIKLKIRHTNGRNESHNSMAEKNINYAKNRIYKGGDAWTKVG